MPKPQKWDQHLILAALHQREMTLTKLAEINGHSSGYWRQVWKRPIRKAEAAISKFLNIPVEELFPDRYPIRSTTILSSKYAGAGASPKSKAPLRSAA